MKRLRYIAGWSVSLLWPAIAGAQDITLKPLKITVPDTVLKSTTKPPLPLKPAPLSYHYYQGLGAACKMELKLEKATKVPFRFRLGSLQQTDYMEQKPNSPKP